MAQFKRGNLGYGWRHPEAPIRGFELQYVCGDRTVTKFIPATNAVKTDPDGTSHYEDELTLNENRGDRSAASRSVTIRCRALASSGYPYSAWYEEVCTNPLPAIPSPPIVTSTTTGVSMQIPPSADVDHVGFRLHMDTAPGFNPLGSTAVVGGVTTGSNNCVYVGNSSSIDVEIPDGIERYFAAYARDLYGYGPVCTFGPYRRGGIYDIQGATEAIEALEEADQILADADATLAAAQGVLDGKLTTANALIASTNAAQTAARTALETALQNADTLLQNNIDGKADADEFVLFKNEVSDARGTKDALGARLLDIDTSVAGKALATDLTALTTRVTSAEGVNTAQNTRLNTAESDIAGKASATTVTALSASVAVRNRTFRQTTQPANPTGGYALIAGDSWINTTSGQNNAHSMWTGSAWTAVTDPRIGTSATGITDLTAKIGTISGTVADALTGKAAASDLTALTTRVTSAEGVNTAQNTRLNTAESNIAGKASAAELTTLLSEINTARNGSSNLNAQLTTMRTTVSDGLAGKANTTDLTALTARVTGAEGVNTAQNTRLNTAESDIAGKASASSFTALQSEVTTARNGSETLTAKIQSVESTISTNETSTATRITSLTAAVRDSVQTPAITADTLALWSRSESGAPDVMSSVSSSVLVTTDRGPAFEVVNNEGYFSPKRAMTLIAGKVYRMTLTAKQTAGGLAPIYFYKNGLNGSYVRVGSTGNIGTQTFTALDTWQTFTATIAADTIIADGGAVYWRPRFRTTTTGGPNTMQFLDFLIEDITDANGLEARITTVENTTFDLAANKADASRVTNVEANVIASRPTVIGDPSGTMFSTGTSGTSILGAANVGSDAQGYYYKTTGTTAWVMRQAVGVQAGRVINVKITHDQIGGDIQSSRITGWCYDETGAPASTSSISSVLLVVAPDSTGNVVQSTFGLAGSGAARTLPANCAFVRFGLQPNRSAGTNGECRGRVFEITDGTENTSLNTRVQTVETATSDLSTNKAEAARVTLLEAKAQGSIVNKNNDFSIFPTTPGLPTGLSLYGTGTTTRVTSENTGNAVRLVSPAATLTGLRWARGGGVNTWRSWPRGTRRWVVEFSFKLVAGSLQGAGILAQMRDVTPNSVRGTALLHFADKYTSVVGETYTGSILFESAAAYEIGDADLYAMGHYTSFAGASIAAANTIDWYYVTLRPATDAEARVVTMESVVVDPSGSVAGWTVGTAVAGASTFISAQSRTSVDAAPTSDVGIGAKTINLYNSANDDWKLALQVSGGNAIFTGGLQAGTFMRLGSGTGWAVALQSKSFTAADGAAISFGANLGAIPSYEFSRDNLLPLSTGETYNLKLTSLTATGGTVYAKINTPGTPGTVTLTTDAVGTTGTPARIMTRTGAEATTGDYTITASGLAKGRYPDSEPGEYMGTVTVKVFARKSGVWSQVGTMAAVMEMMSSGGGPLWYSFSQAYNVAETFQMGDGVEAFGVSYGSVSGICNSTSTVADLNSATWTTPGTSSGTRTALASGAKASVKIMPRN